MKYTHAPVLLVENDPTDIMLVKRAFQRAQLDILLKTVPNGDEAIAYLRGDGPYAERSTNPLPLMLIVDLKMPPPSGIEVIGWVRAQPFLRRLPVVVLSSSRDHADIDRAYDAGASSYLVKPVAFDALQVMLTTFAHYWLNFNTSPTLSRGGEGRASNPS